ncbi:hypothetical protein PISMIDRAFT_106355, partial [Pisolithus microcarpus 441]
NWVRIKKSPYNGDVGYVKESTESDAVVLVAPRHVPYDLPEESGKRVLFDIELARMAGLDLVPVLSPCGTEIRYSCGGEEFIYRLLRLMLLVDTLELLDLPHPDNIRFHVATEFDLQFVKRMLNLFSAQFWQEQDAVEVHEGELRSKRGVLVDVNWHKQSTTVLCDNDTFKCNLHELCRVFKIGDTVEVIAGPFCGETGYIVTQCARTIVLIIMQANRTLDNVNLPGDVFEVHHGPYAGQMGIIEWISPDSKVWVSDHGKGKSKGSALVDGQTPTPGQTMVAMDMSDLLIKPALNTLTFSKDKGYNVAMGDTVEVARGQWYHSEGLVKAVDLTKTSLDVMHTADRTQINVPITFVHKIKECSDCRLSNFVGHDVWIIAGNKKVIIFIMLTDFTYQSLTVLTHPYKSLPILHQSPYQSLTDHLQSVAPYLLQAMLPFVYKVPIRQQQARQLPSVGLSDMWSVTPADIMQTQTLDHGMSLHYCTTTTDISVGDVPWLFKSNFCNFKSNHLGFNVSVSFTQVSLSKHVVQTVCPDQFSGQNGVALPGSVCVTVTGHNAGSAMQHLTIPAWYLTPANPTSANP